MKFPYTKSTVHPRDPENNNPNESGWNARLMLLGVGFTVGVGIIMALVSRFIGI